MANKSEDFKRAKYYLTPRCFKIGSKARWKLNFCFFREQNTSNTLIYSNFINERATLLDILSDIAVDILSHNDSTIVTILLYELTNTLINIKCINRLIFSTKRINSPQIYLWINYLIIFHRQNLTLSDGKTYFRRDVNI